MQLVEAEGLILTVPTRIGTLTELPATARELCEQVPGLGLTLDPSHFINGPHQGGSYDEIFPYVRHVQLRDTGKAPGKFQVRVGQGEVEYGRIISQLQRCIATIAADRRDSRRRRGAVRDGDRSAQVEISAGKFDLEHCHCLLA